MNASDKYNAQLISMTFWFNLNIYCINNNIEFIDAMKVVLDRDRMTEIDLNRQLNTTASNHTLPRANGLGRLISNYDIDISSLFDNNVFKSKQFHLIDDRLIRKFVKHSYKKLEQKILSSLFKARATNGYTIVSKEEEELYDIDDVIASLILGLQLKNKD